MRQQGRPPLWSADRPQDAAPAEAGLLATFGAGFLVSVGVGLGVFRGAVFDPLSPAFHCLTVGALAAGVLTLLAADRVDRALLLTAGFALLRLGFVQAEGWAGAIGGVFLGAGVLVTGVIFDLLGRYGIRLGKFLVLGPLLGGVYVALAPLTALGRVGTAELYPALLRQALVGVLIGDAVGLGVELAELVRRRGRAMARIE